jgi:LAO/AO transport system kinase
MKKKINSRKLAKLISKIENNEYKKKNKRNFNAHVLGVTGPLGVGKSSLIFQLGNLYAKQGIKTGIILNDPSSENGGSFLGDRIRMQKLSDYENVFIRSLSTKDSGGISEKTREIINILENNSFEKIIVESVGAGQSEIEIACLVDTCVVVLMPDIGDEIQMLKSGINEIADIFVVNKSDKKNAERTAREIEMLVNLKKSKWNLPVVLTSALKNKGISELIEHIEEHHKYFKKNFEVIRKKKLKREFRLLLKHEINKKIEKNLNKNINNYTNKILNNKIDASTAVQKIVKKLQINF